MMVIWDTLKGDINTDEHWQQYLTICKAGSLAECVAHQIIERNQGNYLLETWLTAHLSLPGNYRVWEANSWVFQLHWTTNSKYFPFTPLQTKINSISFIVPESVGEFNMNIFNTTTIC